MYIFRYLSRYNTLKKTYRDPAESAFWIAKIPGLRVAEIQQANFWEMGKWKRMILMVNASTMFGGIKKCNVELGVGFKYFSCSSLVDFHP